jgi:hypothetical protein
MEETFAEVKAKVLVAIRDSPGAVIQEIAKASRVDASRVSRAVEALMSAGEIRGQMVDRGRGFYVVEACLLAEILLKRNLPYLPRASKSTVHLAKDNTRKNQRTPIKPLPYTGGSTLNWID